MKNMKCNKCGKKMTTVKDKPYIYKECGLDDVTITGITVYKCQDCDEDYVSIPRIKELHNVIATMICEKRGRLNAKEVRFIRKEMRMKSTEFAMMLGVGAKHVSRIENDKKPVSGTLGRLIRAMYTIYSREGAVVGEGTFNEIARQHEETGAPFDIKLRPDDWLRKTTVCPG